MHDKNGEREVSFSTGEIDGCGKVGLSALVVKEVGQSQVKAGVGVHPTPNSGSVGGRIKWFVVAAVGRPSARAASGFAAAFH
jgi:hypothetical protein